MTRCPAQTENTSRWWRRDGTCLDERGEQLRECKDEKGSGCFDLKKKKKKKMMMMISRNSDRG